MEKLELTEEEIKLIKTRRLLRSQRVVSSQEEGEKALRKDSEASEKKLEQNRPPGWDNHCDPCRVHKGRLTDKHPMYWFEDSVFKKIPNQRHKAEHKKITEILGMPVQTNSRDRVYHALCHLDVLWTEGNLPISFKKKYEDYKKEQGIGDDNIHPAHKKEGVVYPVPKNKKPWNEEDYTEEQLFAQEEFVA